MRRLGQTAAKASARISRVLERGAVLLHGIAHAISEKAGTLALGDGIPCLEACRLVTQTLVASSRVSRRLFGAALLPRRKVAVASRVVRVEGIRRIRLTRRAHYIASCASIAGGAPDRTSRRTTLSLVGASRSRCTRSSDGTSVSRRLRSRKRGPSQRTFVRLLAQPRGR